VLIVLDDDTGLAAWSPFGGRIEMPTLQRLADDGLTFSQRHTTALCPPTRSWFDGPQSSSEPVRPDPLPRVLC
jgi:arylsulfatase